MACRSGRSPAKWTPWFDCPKHATGTPVPVPISKPQFRFRSTRSTPSLRFNCWEALTQKRGFSAEVFAVYQGQLSGKMRAGPLPTLRAAAFGHVAVTPWHRAPSAACSAMASFVAAGAPAVGTQLQLQQLAGATVSVITSRGAAFWQLVIAFICGGIFVTGAIGAIVLAYTYGATNVERVKRMISVVVRRTVRLGRRRRRRRPAHGMPSWAR